MYTLNSLTVEGVELVANDNKISFYLTCSDSVLLSPLCTADESLKAGNRCNLNS